MGMFKNRIHLTLPKHDQTASLVPRYAIWLPVNSDVLRYERKNS
jgi:hypothetical protein